MYVSWSRLLGRRGAGRLSALPARLDEKSLPQGHHREGREGKRVREKEAKSEEGREEGMVRG